MHAPFIHSQNEITSRIDQFLYEYRDELASMPKETFAEHNNIRKQINLKYLAKWSIVLNIAKCILFSI